MNNPAKYLRRMLGASAFAILLAAALNFAVDPLQLFRPARFFAAMYSPDNRMQNAGLIHSQDFDTVLMGTSLAIHFRQSDIDRALGVRSIKLAMTGSNSKQQGFVLAAALQRHPKRVIWQIDDWIFREAPDVEADIYLPVDLYRRNARGIAGYLFSGAMARESLWILARSIPPLQPAVAWATNGVTFKFPIDSIDDINTLPRDSDVSESYNAQKAIAAFRRITDPVRSRYLADGFEYDAMVRRFEHDTLDLIAKNPEVTFDIYFTPYSILHYVAMRDAVPATLKIVYDFAAHALPRLAALPNVRLHDFRAIKDITHDLGNYADVIHHSPVIDRKILSMLADGTHLADRAAPMASLEQLKVQVEANRVP